MSTPQTVTQAPPSVPQGANAPKFLDLVAEAEKWGEQHAQGEDVQIKFALTLTNAADAGTIDLTPNKHGTGIDDAMKLSEAYARGRNRTVIFNHKETKQRKLGSTSRLMIRIGGCPKFSTRAAINDLLVIRQAIRKKDKSVKLSDGTTLQLPDGAAKLDDAFNTLCRWARAQLKLDAIMTPQEMLPFCFRNSSEPQTAQEWLTATAKKALKMGFQPVARACNNALTELAKGKAA